MSLSLAFWIVLLVALLLGGVEAYGKRAQPASLVSGLVLFILLVLLGWATFGAPISA